MLGEEVRRRAEVASVESERREDVLLHVRVPRIAGDLLDHPREVDEAGIRVAVPRSRLEAELLVRHHRNELIPRRGLERLPWLAVSVRPRWVLETSGVRQQHAQRDA